jgi:hypothetical protein
MESSERELIENRILKLREAIKNAKELKILFEPCEKYLFTPLKDVSNEDHVIMNLRRFIENNDFDMCAKSGFDSRLYNLDGIFETWDVNEILHNAQKVIDDKILEFTQEIATNEGHLKEPIKIKKEKHEIIFDEMLSAYNANPGKTNDTYYYKIVVGKIGTSVPNIRQTVYDWVYSHDDFNHQLKDIWKLRSSQKAKKSYQKNKSKKN